MRRITLTSGMAAVTAVVHEPVSHRGVPALLAPGAGGDLDTEGLRSLAEVLYGLGHPVVRVNLPHHQVRGRAPRAERSVGAFRDLLEAARRELAHPGPWLLGGRSYGGRVASMAVADGEPAVGLVLSGYPLHPPGHPERLRIAHWPTLDAPCLFLQGDRDPFATLALLRGSLGSLPAPATLHVVRGADHSLRITRAASDDGQASSPGATTSRLAGVVSDWLATLPS
jgi:uncharacterized protein